MSNSTKAVLAKIFVFISLALTIAGGCIGSYALINHMFLKIDTSYWELTLIIPRLMGGFIIGGIAPGIMLFLSGALYGTVKQDLEKELEGGLKALASEDVPKGYDPETERFQRAVEQMAMEMIHRGRIRKSP